MNKIVLVVKYSSKGGFIMVIVFYSDIKRKIAAALLVVLSWAFIYYGSGLLFQKIFLYTFTIGKLFTFSCPQTFEVHRVFTNLEVDDAITVSSTINDSSMEPIGYKFSTYSSLKGKFTFLYPSIFSLNEQEFPGSEILYHIDFNDKENTVHGLVQVWNLPYSLLDFLYKSKDNSLSNFSDFKFVRANIDDKQGYLWDYLVSTNENAKAYKAMEYFFEKDKRIYRISFFSPLSEWSKSKENVFWKMVKSFKVEKV